MRGEQTYEIFFPSASHIVQFNLLLIAALFF